MRNILILPLILPPILLGACAAHAQPGERAARVAYGDLDLSDAAGRDLLRDRVSVAARDYCQRHGGDVTPQLIRTEASFCLDTLRQSFVAEMSPAVRRAYLQR